MVAGVAVVAEVEEMASWSILRSLLQKRLDWPGWVERRWGQ